MTSSAGCRVDPCIRGLGNVLAGGSGGSGTRHHAALHGVWCGVCPSCARRPQWLRSCMGAPYTVSRDALATPAAVSRCSSPSADAAQGPLCLQESHIDGPYLGSGACVQAGAAAGAGAAGGAHSGGAGGGAQEAGGGRGAAGARTPPGEARHPDKQDAGCPRADEEGRCRPGVAASPRPRDAPADGPQGRPWSRPCP